MISKALRKEFSYQNLFVLLYKLNIKYFRAATYISAIRKLSKL